MRIFNSKTLWINAGAAIIILLFALGTAHKSNAQSDSFVPLSDVQMLADGEGWVLVGNELFWTSSNGISWNNISPSENVIKSIFFIDSAYGFVVTMDSNANGFISYKLNVTRDQGDAWNTKEIIRYDRRKPQASTDAVHTFFLDENTGWVVLKQATSSNFNIGVILRTEDGGTTWQESSAPLGEPVRFLNESTGFMAGGLHDQILYRTSDGGQTWEEIDLAPNDTARVQLPSFAQNGVGYLPVLEISESPSIRIFRSIDQGATWEAFRTIELEGGTTESFMTSGTPDRIFVAAGSDLIIFDLITHQVDHIWNSVSEKITSLHMISSGIGWAITNEYICETPNFPGSCSNLRELVYTDNNGKNWTKRITPLVQSFSADTITPGEIAPDAIALLPRTSFLKGQGFDKCEISSLSNLQAWKTNGPFSAVNLYIGGVTRGCANVNLSGATAKSFVEALSIQGWKFIPTWVGHQAACTGFSYTMPYNLSLAEQLGRDNAFDAARIAMKLGLADENQSGTVIYYDLEGFDTTNSSCVEAAKAFINGWVDELHTEYGIMAGVYGSVCSSALAAFATIPNPPDVIWPAAWSTNVYNSSVDAYGLPCLSDSSWGDQQRIYQYTGGHNENWGGVLMNVDLNVVDGVVADISKFVGVPNPNLNNASFEAGSISPWSINSSQSACTWSISNTVTARDGNNYLGISRTNLQSGCVGVSQSLPLSPSPGDSYRFAVWARSPMSGNDRSVRLKISLSGSNSESNSRTFTGIPDEWTCLEVAHTAQNNGLNSLRAEVLLEDSDGIQVYIDDARLSLNTASLCPTVLLPSGLNASKASAIDQINLFWDSVPAAAYYQVFRSATKSGEKTRIGETSAPNFTDFNGDFLDVYFYWIKACNAGKCSPFSSLDAGSFSSPLLNFHDNFEYDTTARWNNTINSNYIYTCSENSINGSFSLCLNANLPDDAFLQHWLPNPTNSLDLTFTLDPNDALLSTREYTLIRAMDGGTTAFALALKDDAGTYKIRLKWYHNGSVAQSGWFAISNSPSTIKIRWNSSLAHLRAFNSFREIGLFVNDVEKLNVSGLNNSGVNVDKLHVGAFVSTSNTGTGGVILFDDIRIHGPFYIRQTTP
jgi:photosystem II stability/assembly factor-like uncharacterized protein